MRTIIILCTVGAMSLMSCAGIGKKGSGHVVTRERIVSPFTKVSVDGVFPVEISQDGSKEFVKIETDENLQDQITVQNDGDELSITTKNGAQLAAATRTKVYINIKNIRELDFSSVGSLSTSGMLKLDSLELNSGSVGKLNMQLTGKFFRANLSSVGTTTFSGKVHEVRINNKSVGMLSAFDLKADTLRIHNTGIGSTEIYAEHAFFIRSESVGSLTYKGPGQVLELSSEGIGKVKKQDQ